MNGIGLIDGRKASPSSQDAGGRYRSCEVERALSPRETSALILDAVDEGIFGLDLDGRVTFSNPAAERMTGWNLEDLWGRSPHGLVLRSHPEDGVRPHAPSPIHSTLRHGVVHRVEDEVFWRKDGTGFPVAYTHRLLQDDGVEAGAVIVFRDITDELRRRRWEQHRNEIARGILEGKPLSATLGELVENYQRVQPGSRIEVFRLGHGQGVDRLLLEASAGQTIDHPPTCLECDIAETGLPVAQAAFWGRAVAASLVPASPDADGCPLSLQEAAPLLSTKGEMLGVLSVTYAPGVSDVSGQAEEVFAAAQTIARMALEQNHLQQVLLHQSQHDYLTGLPNRMLLEDRLQQAMMSARRRGKRVGVCYIDLDRFKQINDTLGHGTGDRFLQQVSQRFRAECREVDTLARQGGDEFILVLPDVESAQESQNIAERLLDSLRAPFQLEEDRLSASATIGVSVYPEDGGTPELLLQNADTALYAAKRAGRGRVMVFSPELGQEARRYARLCTDLQSATAHPQQQFCLQYQPIFGVDRTLRGFEALLRWNHPELGSIGPDTFIPVAEETGCIVPLGGWVVREACRQAAEWQREEQSPVRIFVNISGVQLAQNSFAETVESALREAALSANLLELEITESWIVADPAAASRQLQVLREIGVGISIDDFGTGHSSLGCLHNLPLDTLKIDRSFISRLDGDPGHLSTVRAIVVLAQQLGLRTVAEGVENEKQLEQLSGLNCDLLQGYLMARPLSPEDASALVARSGQ